MISDVKTRAVVTMTADTSDLEKGIERVTRKEREMHAEREKGAKASSRNLKDTVIGFGAAGVAAFSFGKAAEFAWEQMKASVDHTRLAAATAGIDMERLRKASQNLTGDTELLKRTAMLNAGAFRFTTSEMVNAEGAIRALTLRGIEQGKASEAIQKAMMGEIGQLKELGLAREKNADVMATINGLAAEAAQKGLLAGEGMAQAAIKASDEWSKFKRDLVQTIDLLTVVPEYAEKARRRGQLGGGFLADTFAIAHGYDEDKVAAAVDAMDRAVAVGKSLERDAQILRDRQRKMFEGMTGGAAGGAAAGALKRSGSGSWSPSMPGYSLGDTSYGSGTWGIGEMSPVSDSISSEMLVLRANELESERWRAELTAFRGQSDSFMEATFGKIETIDLYKNAFDGLTASLSAGFGAWIDGSMSAGKAFKMMLGESLKSTAVEMFSQSIKHAAYAAGSLAFGRFDQAAMHGKAAALHLAGSVALGGLAKATIGGGGSSGASPGGGVPTYSGGSNRDSESGSHTTIVYGGPDMHGSSDRQRMLSAKRIVNAALVQTDNGMTYR